jgi:hypothetical protein
VKIAWRRQAADKPLGRGKHRKPHIATLSHGHGWLPSLPSGVSEKPWKMKKKTPAFVTIFELDSDRARPAPAPRQLSAAKSTASVRLPPSARLVAVPHPTVTGGS